MGRILVVMGLETPSSLLGGALIATASRQGDRRVSTAAAAGAVNEPLIWRVVLMSEMPMVFRSEIANRQTERWGWVGVKQKEEKAGGGGKRGTT
ncbi:hypothetical protein EYF80_005994 [Liparis tanakae]|uniref:Uncharacterized protein n=1 Tax=Liparis tanakae TaxID=230148 RepID=A0A4Z2J279_9TELE|nr:hypothetical protein EYF80_005994 [Liparis tanakae]